MKRNNTIDFVKCIAIFFIVVIHIHPFSNIKIGNLEGTVITNITNTIGRFAVPFFFTISGYLLHEKLRINNKPNEYFKNHLFKNIKLYVTWMLFYLIFDLSLLIIRIFLNDLNFYTEIFKYLSEYSLFNILYFGTSTTSFALWFLLALIWSNITAFTFYKINKIEWLLIISLLLNLIGQFGQGYSEIIELPIDTKDAMFFGLFYTTLGFYISKNYDWLKSKLKISLNQMKWLILILTITQLIERFLILDIAIIKGINYYLSTIPLTFIIVMYVLSAKEIEYNDIILKIGRNSFGIFVTHIFFIYSISYILGFLNLSHLNENVLWHLLFTPFIVLVSHYSYLLLQKTKLKVRSRFKITEHYEKNVQ